MADLVAADVTVTVEDRFIKGKERHSYVKIAFGNGTLTYPANGVPMPAASSFGMVRNLDRLVIYDSDDAQGIMWKYDKENKKLRGYIMGLDVTAAGAGTLDDFPLDTAGEPLAEAASIGAVGLEAGVNLLGRFMELKAAASTPAAQTLYALAIGW
jgi:hypothetical protein